MSAVPASTGKTGRFAGWFSRAKSGIDALPIHLPVRLGSAGMTQTKAAPVRVLGFDQALVWVTVAPSLGTNPVTKKFDGPSDTFALPS